MNEILKFVSAWMEYDVIKFQSSLKLIQNCIVIYGYKMTQASNYLWILYGGVSILHIMSSEKDDMIRKQSSFYIFGYPRWYVVVSC